MKLYFDNLKRKLFVSADWHVRHNRQFIFGARGFNTVQEHDDYILNRVNEHIGPDDALLLLGDIMLMSTTEDLTTFIDKIKCRNIYYVWGNHEKPSLRLYRQCWIRGDVIKEPEDDEQWVHYKEKFWFAGDLLTISVEKQHAVCCHYPMMVWNHSHHGSIHLHGHCHGSCQQSLPNHSTSKRLDVGVDVAIKHIGQPFFSWDDIMVVMAGKSIETIDHHTEDVD